MKAKAMTLRTGQIRPLLASAALLAAALLTRPALAQSDADHVIFGVRAPILTLDPALSGLGTMHGYYDNIYSNLVSLDAQSHVVPDLAESWRVVDDLTIEFKLRPNVKCHDGTTLDAASVKASFERLPTVPNSDGLTAGKLRPVVQLQVIDPLTVRMVTAKPYPALLGNLPEFHIVCASAPANITTADFDAGKGEFGSGPYKVVRWQRGQALELERFDGYYGAKPVFPHVTLREIPNDASRMASLEAGDIQIADYVPPLDVKRLEANPATSVSRAPSNRTVFLGFDELRDVTPFAVDKNSAPLPKNPFKDERVRHAMALAISQEVIIKRVMEGLAELATQGVAPHIDGADLALKPRPYDSEQAKKLLAEAGYPEGFRTTLNCPNDRYVNDAAICQTVGVLLSRIGITVAVDAQPSNVFFPRLLKRDYSFYLLAWGSNGGDASSFLHDVMETRDTATGTGSWNGGISMPDVDKAIDAATLVMDPAKRTQLMAAAMGTLIERQAYIPLHTQLVIAATRKPVTYVSQASEATLAYAAGR